MTMLLCCTIYGRPWIEATGCAEQTAKFVCWSMPATHRASISLPRYKTPTVAITGAAFIKGYQSRAVSIGRDGKARIVDFDLGGKILRTWHVKAPATSLSVYQTKPASPTGQSPGKRKAASRPTSQTSSTQSTASDHIIAIGRQDGKVLLFNAIGLLLQEKVVDSDSNPVLGVHWTTRAARPMALEPNTASKAASQANSENPSAISSALGSQNGDLTSKEQTIEPEAAAKQEHASDLDDFLANEEDWTEIAPTEEITPLEIEGSLGTSIDEDMSGTVNFTPLKSTVERQVPAIPASNYMDLFSPVKPGQAIDPPVSPKRNARRIRPRLRSSTFVDKSSRELDSALHSSLNSVPDDFSAGEPDLAQRGSIVRSTEKLDAASQPESAWETTDEASPLTAKGSNDALDAALQSENAWETATEASPTSAKKSDDTLHAVGERSNPPKLTVRRAPKARRKNRPSGHARMPGAFMASDMSLLPRTEALISIEPGGVGAIRRNQTDGSGSHPRKIGNIAMLAPYINRPQKSSQSSNKSIDSLVKPLAIPSPKLHKQLDMDEDIWCTSTNASPLTAIRPSRKSRRSQHIQSPLDSDIQSPSLQSDGALDDTAFRSSAFLPISHDPRCSKAPQVRPSPHPLHNARPHHPRSPRSPASVLAGSPHSPVYGYSPPSSSKPSGDPPSKLGPGAARCDPLSMHEWFPRRSSHAAKTSKAPRPSNSRITNDDFGTPLRRRLLPNQSPGSPLSHDSPFFSRSPESPSSLVAIQDHRTATSCSQYKSSASTAMPPCQHEACAEMRDEMTRMRQDIEQMKLEMKELRELVRPRSKGGLGFGMGNSRGREVVDVDGVPNVE
ncbi:hypothetical protein EJ05DRAFT_145351 [Pseudovirgaria hyperparasitica]|uniref:WD40 repeat-like protein n=1 Tax=Pseudovirgaria hyperparasitica TaxID=470096 RepID=A0A6A6VXN2_9PEZI|nr:uncharacterized protein EJ05DRAFT_145351 [Pseudovirgaria hyperparasitica]KAF2754579.1 hypothetical protein EJ05DRAFT_145351 [Pseudovirgaria hyperparasitica]